MTLHFLKFALSGAIGLSSVSLQAADRFSFSPDGSQVIDAQTGLIWRRCTEGQTWTAGTCSGNSISTSWQGAQQRARDAGAGWRLPNVKELASLLDYTRNNPAIDAVAFPRTPVSNYWSSTPYLDKPNFAWAVGFQFGAIQYWHHDIGYRVRLVSDPN